MAFVQSSLSNWWKPSTSSRKAGRLYLVYQLPNRNRYEVGWDPNLYARVEGQKRGHPLRNNQPAHVKHAYRGVIDAAYFIDVSVNVVVPGAGGDLIAVHKGLHHLPHGLEPLSRKRVSDVALRDNGVSVIDVPEDIRVFSMTRVDDGVNIFRTGTAEASAVAMTRGTKRAFLKFLIGDDTKKYCSKDASRDVGSNVRRYDLMFNQSQRCCDELRDHDGNVIVDRNGSSLRVPMLRKQTEMLRMMPDEMMREFIRVLVGLDNVTQKVYSDAFPDNRRCELVRYYFAHDYLGEGVTINWEYIGLIARRVSEVDTLAMHVDSKNDWRKGYDYCSTYSFVLDHYRVTIIAACKSDFGSLMDRLDGVEVVGGCFVPAKN